MRKRNLKKARLAVLSLLVAGMFAFTGCGAEEGSNAEAVNQIAQEEGDDSDGEVAEEEAGNVEVVYEELKEGDDAPDFTAQLADGSTFNLSDYRGQVVVLNFWATWCGPCVKEMPAFQRLQEEYEGREEFGAILAINCMEDAEVVKQFLEENGYTFPVAVDEEGELSRMYPSDGIPYTLFIRQDGVINNIYVGAVDADTQYQIYKDTLDAILYE